MESKGSGSISSYINQVLGYIREQCSVLKELLEDGTPNLSRAVRKVRDAYYDVKGGIKSIIYYLPVIWKSREWDHSYCLDLYIASLRRLKKSLQNSEVVDASVEVKNLDLIIKMLSVYNNEDDTKTYKKGRAELLKKYGLTEKDMEFDLSPADSRGLHRVSFRYEKLLTEKQLHDFSNSSSSLYKEELSRKRDYFKRALIMVYQKSHRFWD